MDKKKQPHKDSETSSDYRFNNLYCHPDFLSGNDDNVVEQVFGNASKIGDSKKGGNDKPVTMHANHKRKR